MQSENLSFPFCFLVFKIIQTKQAFLYLKKNTFENQKVLDDHAYNISSYPFLKSLSDVFHILINKIFVSQIAVS